MRRAGVSPLKIDSGSEAKSFVLRYLEAKGKKSFPADSDSEKMQCRYLDAGLVDSMGIIDMVLEIEKHFEIHFSPEDLQSMEFRTVGGLIGIIKKAAAKN